MKISYKSIKLFAVLYAAVPIAIFFLGWLNIVAAIFFLVLLAGAVYFFAKNSSHYDGKAKSITISKKQLVILAVMALLWCVIAGQGQFIHQSKDHIYRNAIFMDLIWKQWPVTYDNGTTIMSYYIAHWMVPAFMGKIALGITGSKTVAYMVGRIILLLWSSAGCYIVFLLVSLITNVGNKKRIFIAVLLFVFFSGLDIIGVLLRKKLSFINDEMHLEWWAIWWFQYSSTTTCLFWVFNQAIVPWIVTLCIINERKLKNIVFLGLLAFPFGPMPFVGICILCGLKTIGEFLGHRKKHTLKLFLYDLFSVQNIMGVCAIAPVYLLYYAANVVVSSGSEITSAASTAAESGAAEASESKKPLFIAIYLYEAIKSNNLGDIRRYVYWYLLFIILEIGVYISLIAKKVKPNIELVGTCIALLIIPLITLNGAKDFSMRASIPGLTLLCITFIQAVMKEIPRWGEYKSFNDTVRHKKWLTVAVIVFLIGSVTPRTEMKRELLRTVEKNYSEIFEIKEDSLQNYGKDNFTAQNYKDSEFYKYFCKKTDEM